MTSETQRIFITFFAFIFLSKMAIHNRRIIYSKFVSDPLSGTDYHAYDESYALIVGVDAYTQVAARTSSVASATSFRELLMSRFGFREENITFLSNGQAKQSAVMDGIRKLQRRGRHDRLLVFLSGRGYTVVDSAGIEHGYFVPFDGQVQSPAAAAATCVSVGEVVEMVGEAGAKQSLLLLDLTVGGLSVNGQLASMPPPRLGFERIVTLRARRYFWQGAGTRP